MKKRLNFGQRIAKAIDHVAYAISPAWGANRMATRELWEHANRRVAHVKQHGATMRAVEAAEQDRLRAGKWLGSRLSTDAWMEEDLETTRQRSRELYRNDFVGGAVDSRVEHVVDTGFTVQPKVRPFADVITAEQADTINLQLKELYAQIEPIACRTRKHSLWQKLCLVARLLDSDGEALVVFSDVGHVDAPIPLVVEVIDVDRLESPPDKATDPLCRMGIQYDKSGRIVGYHIRKNHPNDNKEFGMQYDYVTEDRVCHVFVEWFAGQSRGLPWMTRALNRIKDGKDLHEFALIAAQVEACFAVFIEGSTNPAAAATGASTGLDAHGGLEDVVPGTVKYLGVGQKATFAAPQKTNAAGTLLDYNNRTVSGAVNWPYELLNKDWRGVSFAGGRIILNGVRMTVRSRQKLLREMFLRPYWNRFVEEAVILGMVEIDPRRFAEHAWRFKAHSWTPPKWSYSITPGEEVNAKVTALENNLMTLADALAEDQQDYEEVLEQRQYERELERKYAIVSPGLSQADATNPTPQDQQQAAEMLA